MAEAVFNKVQMGRQAAIGTLVAATFIYPAEPGTVIDLDRSFASPDEDYGGLSQHRPNRSSYGVRGAQLSLAADLTFENIIDLLEMSAAGSVTPSGAGPYIWTYTADETTTTLRPYTIEVGDETQEWEVGDCLIDTLEIGYDALSAPGNSPWRVSATILGADRIPSTYTAALATRSTLETVEGHYTILAEGSTATAFGSLAALTGSLISYKLTINNKLVRRVYGGTTDVFTAWGRSGRREVSVAAMLKMTATTKSNVHDIFNGAGSVAGERRWRVTADGSGNKLFTIDHRLNFEGVQIGDRDGEHVYVVSGHTVYDATLASNLVVIATNDIAAV